MQQYPTFNTTEYSCLKPDLSCVAYWLELDKIQKKIEEVEQERNKLLSSPAARLEDVRKTLCNALGSSRNASSRADRLRDICLDLAHSQGRMGLSESRQGLIHELGRMYGQFDQAAFEQDWEKAVGGGEFQKSLRSVEGKLGPLTTKLNKHRTTLPACFVGDQIPRQWKDSGIAKDAEEHVVTAFGTSIVVSFVTVWRSRASLFNVPVTINGVEISTLATERARTWMDAYQALGLHKLAKSPRYYAIRSGEREMEKHLKTVPAEVSA